MTRKVLKDLPHFLYTIPLMVKGYRGGISVFYSRIIGRAGEATLLAVGPYSAFRGHRDASRELLLVGESSTLLLAAQAGGERRRVRRSNIGKEMRVRRSVWVTYYLIARH